MNTKKTNRKNKTNLTVKWPSTHFTIDELNKQNSDFVNITLRVRLNNAIENKLVIELGTLHVGKGRPKLVFACAPVKPDVIESARKSNVMLHDSFNSVNVTTLTSTPATPTPTTTVVTPVKTAVVKV
jgi:hypothetical protein